MQYTPCVLAAEEGYFISQRLGHSLSLTLQFKALQQLCIPPVLTGRKERLILQDFGEYKGWKMQGVVQVLSVTAGPVP